MRATDSPQFRSILGIEFFIGSAAQAVQRISRGGLLVVPAAPALKNLPHDAAYREALLAADLVIADSAFMVLLWNFLQDDSIRRVSGLAYLSQLLQEPAFTEPHSSLWIMANQESAERNCAWLRTRGIHLTADDIYVAPLYGKSQPIHEPALIEQINRTRPKHIIATIGGGNQERLGLYLRQELDYGPAIHCVGAAIAFLSGDQVRIPVWADRLYLGWLLRCLSDPRRYLPRYWSARKLFALMVRHRSGLPTPHSAQAKLYPGTALR
jgi:UDP-N-acetyl-D-mannosaminuronic acid transferase (WecB/TagA/CpsF family)